jgi:hypothetical protein
MFIKLKNETLDIIILEPTRSVRLLSTSMP